MSVVVANRMISPEPNEVVMSVMKKGRVGKVGRMIQISIDPSFLVPWAPTKGAKVIIVGYRWIGQVGKLVKRNPEGCAVELSSTGEISYFKEADVVNILK